MIITSIYFYFIYDLIINLLGLNVNSFSYS
nr:MAG TPA: hypothetical protein [Caudoviricetes sp.]